MAKVNYSSRVISSTKTTLKKEILVSVESMPNLRKEIARVFQMANRRIQNIEKSGVLSPAYEDLDVNKNAGFAKFNFTGKSWNELKFEYAKAVSFLQKPSSTASGAKQWEEHIKKEYDLTDWQFNARKKDLLHKIMTDAEKGYVQSMKYTDWSGEFSAEARSQADQIENDAMNERNTEKLNEAFDKDLKKIMQDVTEEEVKNIMQGFKNFGM